MLVAHGLKNTEFQKGYIRIQQLQSQHYQKTSLFMATIYMHHLLLTIVLYEGYYLLVVLLSIRKFTVQSASPYLARYSWFGVSSHSQSTEFDFMSYFILIGFTLMEIS